MAWFLILPILTFGNKAIQDVGDIRGINLDVPYVAAMVLRGFSSRCTKLPSSRHPPILPAAGQDFPREKLRCTQELSSLQVDWVAIDGSKAGIPVGSQPWRRWRRYARYSEVLQTCKYVYVYIYIIIYWLVVTGTCFIFHNIWDNPSRWLIFFRGVETTNQYIYIHIYMYSKHIHPFVDSDKKALDLAISHHISPHETVVSPYPYRWGWKKGGNPCF